VIKVFYKSESLNADGVVCDCSKIKSAVVEAFDHKELNELIPQPTMENIAKYVFDLAGGKCFKVEVTETENNMAIYEK
jgi:6-pyruvoyltetrahydropterin/6-carboxytetrahydropterin synthase